MICRRLRLRPDGRGLSQARTTMTRGRGEVGREWAGGSVRVSVGKSEVCHFAIVVSTSPGINNSIGKHDTRQQQTNTSSSSSNARPKPKKNKAEETSKTHLYFHTNPNHPISSINDSIKCAFPSQPARRMRAPHTTHAYAIDDDGRETRSSASSRIEASPKARVTRFGLYLPELSPIR